MTRITTLAAASLLALTSAAHAVGGDLSSLPEQLETLEVGTGDNGFGIDAERIPDADWQSLSPERQGRGLARMQRGGGGGGGGGGWEAPSFFKNSWLRKIEAGGHGNQGRAVERAGRWTAMARSIFSSCLSVRAPTAFIAGVWKIAG